MKLTIEFDTENNRDEVRIATNAAALMSGLGELNEYLRQKVKYQGDTLESASEELNKAREKLWELLNGAGLCPIEWL